MNEFKVGDLVTPLKRGDYEPSDERDELFGKVLMVSMVLPGEGGLCRAGVIEGEQWYWFSDDLRLVCAARPEQPKPKPRKSLKRGDLVTRYGHIGVVVDVSAGGSCWVHPIAGEGSQDYFHFEELTKVGSVRKKAKRLLKQMECEK